MSSHETIGLLGSIGRPLPACNAIPLSRKGKEPQRFFRRDEDVASQVPFIRGESMTMFF